MARPPATFLSEDPLRFAVASDFYAYIGNNPILYKDPLGLCQKPTCLQVFLGAIGDEASQALQNAEDLTNLSLQSVGAAAQTLAIVNFNDALDRGEYLAAAAMSFGGISYAFRSTLIQGFLNAAERLSSVAESTTSEAAAGWVTVDFGLYKGLGKEIDAVRNGTCIPEGKALKAIILNR